MFEASLKSVFQPGDRVWYICYSTMQLEECEFVKYIGLKHRLKLLHTGMHMLVDYNDAWREYLPALKYMVKTLLDRLEYDTQALAEKGREVVQLQQTIATLQYEERMLIEKEAS